MIQFLKNNLKTTFQQTKPKKSKAYPCSQRAGSTESNSSLFSYMSVAENVKFPRMSALCAFTWNSWHGTVLPFSLFLWKVLKQSP